MSARSEKPNEDKRRHGEVQVGEGSDVTRIVAAAIASTITNCYSEAPGHDARNLLFNTHAKANPSLRFAMTILPGS